MQVSVLRDAVEKRFQNVEKGEKLQFVFAIFTNSLISICDFED